MTLTPVSVFTKSRDYASNPNRECGYLGEIRFLMLAADPIGCGPAVDLRARELRQSLRDAISIFVGGTFTCCGADFHDKPSTT